MYWSCNKDKVTKWMELATYIPSPDWLQTHPKNYLNKMLEKSKEQVKLLKQGGKVQTVDKQQEFPSEGDNPKTIEVNYVNYHEGFAPISSLKECPYDSSLMQVIIDRNKHLGSAKCIK